jgi:splicing factor 3B subunit 3
MATTSNMFLYSLTIQPPTHTTQAVLGQFSGTKEQHVMTASGSRLTLLRPDPSQGKVVTILSHDIFGVIRSMAAFRLAGSNKGMRPDAPHLGIHLVIWKFSTCHGDPRPRLFHFLM